MRAMLGLALSLACAACTAPAAGPPPGVAATPQSAVLVSGTPPQTCRAYTTPVLVGGKDATAAGVACEQADGTWRLTDSAPAPAAQGPGECREYTVPIIVGGAQKQGVGESCQQPDGSWRIVWDTPGRAPQAYAGPPPAGSAISITALGIRGSDQAIITEPRAGDHLHD